MKRPFHQERRNDRGPRHPQRPHRTSVHDAQARSQSVPRRLDESEARFLAGVPIDPSPRMRLEDGSSEHTVRALDLVCPIGMGQRGLIVASPGSGKTTFLKHICQSIAKAYPQVKLYCLLVDERPEEVTDFKRSVTAEVHASSIDQGYEHHVATADTLMKKAMTEAGNGENVVLLIDSLTRLSRVHNAERRSSGRTLSGGVDARAMEVPRRIFGAARKIENGGSLTILATILVETGSRMDDVIFEEFKGTGNMEIVLSRDLAQRRIFPAIDIAKSGTRRMEKMLEAEELRRMDMLRRALVSSNTVEAGAALLRQLEKHPRNEDLLSAVAEAAQG